MNLMVLRSKHQSIFGGYSYISGYIPDQNQFRHLQWDALKWNVFIGRQDVGSVLIMSLQGSQHCLFTVVDCP